MPEQVTNGGVTYQDFQADTPMSIKAEKRALNAMLAEHGTEGAILYDQSKQATADARAASIEAAAARGSAIHRPAALGASLVEDYDAILDGTLQNADSGAIGHYRELDRISAANSAYLDQAASASQLNRDLLAGSLTGGSGGGGGSGSGGGGTSSYTAGDFATSFNMSLEEAGAAAGGSGDPGLESGGIAVSGSGTRRLFGEEGVTGEDVVYGNEAMVAVRESLEAMQAAGASKEEMMDTLLDMIEPATQSEDGTWVNDEDQKFSPHQRSFALATLDNYFGLTAEGQAGEATVNTYSSYGGDYETTNPYTEEGRNTEDPSVSFDNALAEAMNAPDVQEAQESSRDATARRYQEEKARAVRVAAGQEAHAAALAAAEDRIRMNSGGTMNTRDGVSSYDDLVQLAAAESVRADSRRANNSRQVVSAAQQRANERRAAGSQPTKNSRNTGATTRYR